MHKPWQKVSEREWIAHFTSSSGENTLYAKSYLPIKEIKKVFFLFHDLGQYHESFDEFIVWTRKNFDDVMICTLDYAGHGLSSGTRGHVGDIKDLILDQKIFIDFFQFEDHQNYYLFGHGLGGLVTLDLLNRFRSKFKFKIKGLILSNFILDLDHPVFKMNALSKAKKFQIFQRLRMGKIFDTEHLTSNDDKLLFHEHDPLTHFNPTFHTLLEVKKLSTGIYQEAYYLDTPTFFAYSLNDPYIFKRGMEYFVKGIRKDLLCEKRYSNMKHDLYNEDEKELFYNDIKEWIEKNE